MVKTEIPNEPGDNAGVRVPPPLVFFSFLMLGLWYDSPWFDWQSAGTTLSVAGGAVAAIGFFLILIGAWRHKQAGSNVEPWKTTTTILSSGVYGYSRNPIYLGMAIFNVGMAICGGSVAALVTLVPALAVIRIFVIAKEERYLEAKFGEVYSDYKKQVRMWI